MQAYRIRITLRITHLSCSLQKISRALSPKSNGGWIAGEQRRTPTGRLLKGNRKFTYWYRELKLSQRNSLDKALSILVARFSKKREFFRNVRADGGSIEFFVGWFFKSNSGDVLEHTLLEKLADLQIDLSLDIYHERKMSTFVR